jgi:hypothetical protein
MKQIYSWRLSAVRKRELEQAAREKKLSFGVLLDRIVAAWLETKRRASGDNAVVQRRLHAAAARCLGTIRGGDAHRSEGARELVRTRLKRRRVR